MINQTELNALIGSRICHDLISPLGAIGNGVELLTMTGATAAPEITLIAESVDNANARIRYFRIAFGAAARGSTIGNSEVRGVLADLYRGNRLQVDWRVTGDVPRAQAKLAFLVIQCLESAMPWGGRVKVTRTDDAWNVHGMADRIKVDEPLWRLLVEDGVAAEVSAASVHFALVRPLAQSLGHRVTTSLRETALSVSF